jgi:predicted Zn-dependent protease
MADRLRAMFVDALPKGIDQAWCRFVDSESDELTVRDDVTEPPSLRRDRGAMVTVTVGNGMGYAATSDVTQGGLARAAERAREIAIALEGRMLVDAHAVQGPRGTGRYQSPVERAAHDVPLGERVALLEEWSRALSRPGDARIVERRAALWSTRVETRIVSTLGADIDQLEQHMLPDLSVTAHDAGETITRSLGIRGRSFQGGFEGLARGRLSGIAHELVEDAIALLSAPNCPTTTTDIVLMPDQMMLQIHESIGHPLELDRILGDERNYAGTSFVTLDMFGTYRYGSDLLNVTFAPDVDSELASYAYDDDGVRAERVTLIDKGILVRPLGSTLSGSRAGLPGLANARASSWNRPPIDRMANLNIEPGPSTFDAIIRGTERGVLMETNCSWSIDDARNKFQFSCEKGRLIENGVLGALVKKPCYRGVSSTFWRSLRAVGDGATVEVLGTPYCGKGEPNQAIRVGHASPVCAFANVEVFGGE